MHSFELHQYVSEGHDDYNERVQARFLNSVQFRLQQQINLKDDEISHLKSDLALLQGEVDTLSDTLRAKHKPTKNSAANIQKQISLAKQESQMMIIQCKKNHAFNLQQLDQKFVSEINHLQRKLEKKLFRKTQQSEVLSSTESQSKREKHHSKRKNHKTQDDEIDNFIKSVEIMKVKTNQKISKSEKVKEIVTAADLKLNEKKYEELTEQISNFEKQKHKLSEQVTEQKEAIAKLTQNNDISDLDEDIDNEIDENQPYFDENIKPYNDKVEKTQNKLNGIKQDQNSSLKKLKKKIKLEQEKIQNKKDQMNKKMKETEMIQKKIEEIRQKQKEELEAAKAAKAAEEARKAEEEARRAAEEAKRAEEERKRIEKEKKEAYERKYGRLIFRLKSMTQTEKEESLQLLTEENKALKREIYRIDNMIYGKYGQYREWKNI